MKIGTQLLLTKKELLYLGELAGELSVQEYLEDLVVKHIIDSKQSPCAEDRLPEQEFIDLVSYLKSKGLQPSLYLRGEKWRAHAHRCGNWWHDDENLFVAMKKAAELWHESGEPEVDKETYTEGEPK